MKRGFIVLSICALACLAYFTASKWAIHHMTLTFMDPLRSDRPVAIEVAVRRDREMESVTDMAELPVAILSHGNTVKNTEYSFLTNLFAARGYLVMSIQHDLATDAPMVTRAIAYGSDAQPETESDRERSGIEPRTILPFSFCRSEFFVICDCPAMVTRVGEEYVGRRMQYNRGIFNIKFAIEEMKKKYPNADYDHLTLIGHSNGGDISMYFARLHPEMVKKVVTLDNLRVPFLTDGKIKILSFRSHDPVFKSDPGVVPDDATCAKAGITVVRTEFQHNELSDRGPENVKESIQAKVEQFLDEDDGSSSSFPLLTAAAPAQSKN